MKHRGNLYTLPSGREVFDTGRVLVGSRYQPPSQPMGTEAERLQGVLLSRPPVLSHGSKVVVLNTHRPIVMVADDGRAPAPAEAATEIGADCSRGVAPLRLWRDNAHFTTRTAWLVVALVVLVIAGPGVH